MDLHASLIGHKASSDLMLWNIYLSLDALHDVDGFNSAFPNLSLWKQCTKFNLIIAVVGTALVTMFARETLRRA